MATIAKHFIPAILLIISLYSTGSVSQIGVCYGRNGNALPSPCEVVSLYSQYNIHRMRIYEPNEAVLRAVSGSDIELTIGLPNIDHLQFAAGSQGNADIWVQKYVLNYPDIKFTHIIVGNEVSPVRDDTARYVPFVLPAMQNVYNALSAAGLADQIKVSTSIDTGVLATSYPPEDGAFRSDVTPYLDPIIRFLLETGAPLFAHIYPYFAYLDNPGQIDLHYALLDPTYEGVVTPYGTRYQNLFYALLDAVYAAIEKTAGAASFIMSDGDYSIKSLVVKGGETNSISPGHKFSGNENGAYVNNLIEVVKHGTPKRPDQPIETYIYAMFDENLKDGPEYERHFGLFTQDGQPTYSVNFELLPFNGDHPALLFALPAALLCTWFGDFKSVNDPVLTYFIPILTELCRN